MAGDDTSARDAFEAEALPHLDAVYRFALRLSGAPDTAQDLVQETYLRAWTHWHQFTPGTRPRSWLFTICRNLFLRRREREQRHARIVEAESPRSVAGSGWSEATSPLWGVHDDDPESSFFDSLVDETVLAAVDDLPEEYRTAVVLSDLEGLSYGEIARIMDVPVGTVKSRIFRGRRQLQERLYSYAVEMGYLRPGDAAP